MKLLALSRDLWRNTCFQAPTLKTLCYKVTMETGDAVRMKYGCNSGERCMRMFEVQVVATRQGDVVNFDVIEIFRKFPAVSILCDCIALFAGLIKLLDA